MAKKARRDWSAGYAEADITPPRGATLMCGFGTERYAQGTQTPLQAQVLAIRDARGQAAVLVTADLLTFDRTTVEYVRRRLSDKHGLASSQVMLAASHTHWGPPTFYRLNQSVGPLNPWYLKFLEETILRLADEAMAHQTPAEISYNSMQARIGCCRRTPDGKGSVKWGPYPEGSYDEHTPVLVVDRGRSGQIVLVSHACHPTSTGNLSKWSSEYPGAMRQRIQQRLGRNTRAMFAMGCGADAKVTHTDDGGKVVFSASPQDARRAGVKLADAVLKHLAASKPVPLSPHLATALVEGLLSFGRGPTRQQIEQMAYGKPESVDRWWARQVINFPFTEKRCSYTVQAWRLGDLTLLGLEGEVCSGLGPIARSLVRTPLAATFAYVNRAIGYIPTTQIVREGGYEGESAHRAYFLPAPFTYKVEDEFKTVVRAAVAAL